MKLSYIRLLPHLISYVLLDNNTRECINKDIERYNIYYRININYKFLFLKILNNHKEFRNIFYFRISPFYKIILSVFAKPYSSLYLTPFPKMEIASGGILFQHPFSTIINAHSIGAGCIFRHNTTVGNMHENLKLVPTFLENVNVGASCIIIGKITVGNNVTIGAGTVLSKDVPDDCVIVGNPARIIRKNGHKCNIKL